MLGRKERDQLELFITGSLRQLIPGTEERPARIVTLGPFVDATPLAVHAV